MTLRTALLAVLAALTAALAGCGGSTITKTTVVHPCVTKAAMSQCVQVLTQRYVKDSGSKASTRVRCTVGPRYRCVVAYETSGKPDGCAAILVELLGPGIPYPVSQAVTPQSACVTAFAGA